ncbi:polyamine aminopropyltransferase [Celerinatantimonas diazotrophica]|uniref:Polyamine aminopropyltransferase n=1 Tax=Celerinatantimonas diazotrophica TaxID=412034 RepID=A0A4R1KEX7_9GAMM|nr:polyamine aminopropyltransferase [Celerinatantimonas diazotrophica]TCK63278.1 spermidine synthase [Celerinatantimonas diazotrophica]CAG9298422.1 Polyamine aminopropyltransferase [Celerinatantimonas diazotrophica]
MTSRYFETLHNGYGQYFDIDDILFEQKTTQWHLIIFSNQTFGRVMALDGIIQTTEKDEFIYHEMLTHVPLFAHANPRRVLIIGGGDGAMLREVVKHQTVEEITMVEIDQSVVDMCRTYLPNHSRGAYDDPRVNLVIDDGAQFVANCADRFDVIISDCTDPVGPGEVLFASEFYSHCQGVLNPGGIFVAQNGVPFMQPSEVTTTAKRLNLSFTDSTFYSAAVPTYVGGMMTFAWASDDPQLREVSFDTLCQRFAKAQLTTRYYTPHIHHASFALPRYLLDELGNQ